MKVSGLSEYDPKMKTDRLTSGILQFSKGSATFTCGTQMERFQVVHVFGSKGKIEIKHPFNCLDQEATLILQQGSAIDRISFEPVNTYTFQGDHFSKAIRTLEPSLISVSDSMNNMRVIQQLLD